METFKKIVGLFVPIFWLICQNMFLKVKLIHFLIWICVCIMTNIALWCSATLIRLCRLGFPLLFVFDCNQRCSVFVFQVVYLYFHLCICISICVYHLQYCCAALIRLCRLGQRCQNFPEFSGIFSQTRNTVHTTNTPKRFGVITQVLSEVENKFPEDANLPWMSPLFPQFGADSLF